VHGERQVRSEAVLSRRHELIQTAYEALGRGELAPWMDLLDRAVVWRAVDQPDVGPAPT
jgi:hypothetical protein